MAKKKMTLFILLILNFFMIMQFVDNLRLNANIQDFGSQELLTQIETTGATSIYSTLSLGHFISLILSLLSFLIILGLILTQEKRDS